MNKFCPNCGNKIQEKENFCANCGNQLTKEKSELPKNSTNGLGIAGFVTSLVGLITICFGIGILLGIIALILSIIGLKKSIENNNNKGLSIAGLVISIVTIVMGAFYLYIIGTIFEGINTFAPQFKNELLNNTCKIYGDQYELVKGSEITNSYNYYCCPKNEERTETNCIDLQFNHRGMHHHI